MTHGIAAVDVEQVSATAGVILLRWSQGRPRLNGHRLAALVCYCWEETHVRKRAGVIKRARYCLSGGFDAWQSVLVEEAVLIVGRAWFVHRPVVVVV